MTTVLLAGQASQQTGLARVTRAIADHLAGEDDVHVLGIDCFAGRAARRTEAGWTLHTNPAPYDVFAELELTALLDEVRPDVVLLYNDLWIVSRYFERLDRAAHRCPVVGYCPIDGTIDDPDYIRSVAPLDALVVFTDFARRTVQPYRDAQVIAHGLDVQAFFPVDRDEARRTLFPGRPDLRDGFWVLNANRNQPRKRLDLTLRGFAEFAAGKPPDVRLYLHCGLKDIGIDVLQEARSLGIEDRLLFTHRADAHPRVATSALNLIYNACDVGVNTATGEGWGLIGCEHAATGAAQVVPRHSACAELWEGAAELLSPAVSSGAGLFAGGAIEPSDLAASLERLYADRRLREERGRAAYERITAPQYRWEHIAGQWRALFGDVSRARSRVL
ncbi:MAG TPA: glycosyltransferase family 4 protein [Thermoanaerobaculia bacterium]